MSSGPLTLPRIRSAFRDLYRACEALFATAYHVCEAPQYTTLITNAVGSRRVGTKVADADLDPRVDYIKMEGTQCQSR
jgi:hypothetical protein